MVPCYHLHNNLATMKIWMKNSNSINFDCDRCDNRNHSTSINPLSPSATHIRIVQTKWLFETILCSIGETRKQNIHKMTHDTCHKSAPNYFKLGATVFVQMLCGGKKHHSCNVMKSKNDRFRYWGTVFAVMCLVMNFETEHKTYGHFRCCLQTVKIVRWNWFPCGLEL